MGVSHIPLIIMDEGDRDRYLSHVYNPPSPNVSMDQYLAEWHGVFSGVKTALARHWSFGIGDGDFFIDSDWSMDRILCVEVSSEHMLVPALIRIVHETIAKIVPPYIVDVCDCWTFLKTSNGDSYPHFNCLIEKDRVMIYAESELILKRLGIWDAKYLA